MNVLIDSTKRSARKVEVDDMQHILNIKTASRNPGGDHDRRFGSAESTAIQLLAWAQPFHKRTYSASSRSRWVRSA